VTTVLVDGRPLSHAWAATGSATYLRGLLPALVTEGSLNLRALVDDDGDVPAGVMPVRTRRRLPERLRYQEQLVRLPGDVRRDNPDVFHSPATDPPRRCAVPWVQTLLDLIPLAFPAPIFRLERQLWRARARRIACASAVIAISRHTAEEGMRRIGLDPSRVEVVHLGVDPEFRPPAARGAADPPYILCVSMLGPHKGYREAFAVIGELADAGLPHHLKMLGGIWPSEVTRVHASLAGSRHAARIELVDRVSRAELISLYQQASAVIVTSRYEGFGLPAVEAMATGTPVVAFDNSSLPEVIDDGGVLVADGDVTAFSAALQSVVTDCARWNELSEAGVKRARAFDWNRCAREHSQIMRACAR
jgi:glycosyltransferase involved in cell wall biosynthesis